MTSLEAERGLPPIIGRWRGALYCGGVGFRTLVAMVAVTVIGTPIGVVLSGDGRGTEAAAALVLTDLLLLGVSLPLISVVLSRADWNGAASLLVEAPGRPLGTRLREPRTLVRPLAYMVLMLTLGGAAALLAVLAVVASVVALASPFLTAAGDEAVIGPFTISTVTEAMFAVPIAGLVLTGLVVAAPRVAQAHASLLRQVLTRPEQGLQRDLTMTAQSRTRLIRAFDAERRRIERDLHDGVQPQMMSVSMTLGLALAAMPVDAVGRSDVARAQDQARQSLESLRNFVRNIHPQVLTDHGLCAAVSELADTLPIPIAVIDRVGGRLPPEVETNLYFCVAELLTNVAKHSGADHAEVRLHLPEPGRVEISVRDDGRGGAGTSRHENGGLHGIADRIAAFDGDLHIDSPLGGPTKVSVTLAAFGETSSDG